MNFKKYIIGGGIAAAVLGSSFVFVLAQTGNQGTTTTPAPTPSHPQPQIVQINPTGHTLLRGTVESVGSSSLVVDSWGGSWTVNVNVSPSDTKILPSGSLSHFKVGDFVGVLGQISKIVDFTIDATLMRNWSAKQESQEAKKEIKEIIKAQTPKNWQGTASNINVAGKTFTLTIDGVAHTVNVTADAKIVDKKYFAISLSDIKDGHTVRVWGPLTDTTITASVVRDVSINP